MTEVTGNHRAPYGRRREAPAPLTPASGNLVLRWKASNPPEGSGTSYIIRRRLVSSPRRVYDAATLRPGDDGWAFIGVTGNKEFIDNTLVAGPDSVQYTVQGQRSDVSGPVSEIFTVNFGQAPGGGLMATVTGAMTPSTVDGRPVQKMVPTGNGSAMRGVSRV